MKNRTPPNNFIMCEMRWRIPAALLLAAALFTVLWAFNLMDFHFDDDAYDHYSIGNYGSGATSAAMVQPVALDIHTVQKLVAPAIVHIHDADLSKDGKLPRVLASGVLVHPGGYLVTTHHALLGLDNVKVDIATPTGIRRYSAETVATDPAHDLALLKMNTTDRFMFLKLADNTAIQVGTNVYSFGFGVQSTLVGKQGSLQSRGVVTRVGNQNLTRLVTTDAVYSWEQTGGALVNGKGELVGINLALNNSSGFVDGYAVPAHLIEKAFNKEVRLTIATMAQTTNTQALQPVMPQGVAVAWPNMVPAAATTPAPADTAAGSVFDLEHQSKITVAGYSINTIIGLALLGLVAGIAGGMMTMGGGILLVTGMFVFFGYGMYLIRPVSYLTNLFTYGASSYRNWTHGLVMTREVLSITPWAVGGVLIGYFVGTELDDFVIGYLLGIFALLSAAKALHEIYTKHVDPPVIYRTPEHRPEKDVDGDDLDVLADAIDAPPQAETKKSDTRSSLFKSGMLGLPMGMVSGVLGISGGVVEVPLQRYLANISLRNAIANSSVMVFWTSLSAAIVSFAHGTSIGAFEWQTPFGLALIMIPSSYVGGLLGANLLKHVSANKLRWIYAVLMLIVGIKMLFGQ